MLSRVSMKTFLPCHSGDKLGLILVKHVIHTRIFVVVFALVSFEFIYLLFINFSNFLHLIESIQVQLYSNTNYLIICGDININYLRNTNYKTQLDSLLASYNLSTVVDFPTRITKTTSTTTDNIFMDKAKNYSYTIEPIINGLLDHDAQELTLHNIKIIDKKTQPTVKRLINNTTIAQFKLNLSYESWIDTFTEEDVDLNFKKF
jgi:hypothetical protein